MRAVPQHLTHPSLPLTCRHPRVCPNKSHGIVKAITLLQFVSDIQRVLIDANSYSEFPASNEGQSGVWIHQLSRRHSQAPFKKIKGTVQLVLFHPTKPNFFVAVRIMLVAIAIAPSDRSSRRRNIMLGCTILQNRNS